MRAWLITWEWMSDSAAVVDRIAAVLTPRWSESRVADFSEQFYAHATSNVTELAGIAKTPKNNPYQVSSQDERLNCGAHPWLTGRKVSLEISTDPDGFEIISWTDPDIYRMKADESGVELAMKGASESVRRTVKGPLSRETAWDRDAGRFRTDIR